MIGRLEIRSVQRGGAVELTLDGTITEHAGLNADVVPPGLAVIIDAGRIDGLNSLGVLMWVRFLRSICDKAKRVVIRRLPPTMAAQTNVIAGFLATARVESFLTPWCCIECGLEEWKLFERDEVVPEVAVCGDCGAEMHFDDIRESYLGFRRTN